MNRNRYSVSRCVKQQQQTNQPNQTDLKRMYKDSGRNDERHFLWSKTLQKDINNLCNSDFDFIIYDLISVFGSVENLTKLNILYKL